LKKKKEEARPGAGEGTISNAYGSTTKAKVIVANDAGEKQMRGRDPREPHLGIVNGKFREWPEEVCDWVNGDIYGTDGKTGINFSPAK